MSWVLYLRPQGLLANALGSRNEPTVIVQDDTVLDMDAQAALMGIEAGRPVREARLLAPTASIVPFDVAASRPLYEAWLAACAPKAGAVEQTPPQAAFFSCPGRSVPLDWAQDLATLTVTRFGHAVWAGLAPNKLLAQLAARPGQVGLIRPEQATTFMAAQPPEALWPLPPQAQKRLRQLGVTRLGQLHNLPVQALAPHLGALAPLAVALAKGEDPRPVLATFPRRQLVGKVRLEPPAWEREPIQRAAVSALQSACQKLVGHEGVSVLEVQLEGGGAPIRAGRRFSTPKPAGGGLILNLETLLGQALLPAGSVSIAKPVEGVQVTLAELAPLPTAQLNLFEQGQRSPAQSAIAALDAKYQGTAVRVASQLEVGRMESLMRYLDPLRLGRS